MSEMLEAGEKVYSALKNVCVWDKGVDGMGTFYRSRHEMVFVWKFGTAPHINTFGLGEKGRYRTNVWNYRGLNTGGATRMEELSRHPTAKPVQMLADAMLDRSMRNSIVSSTLEAHDSITGKLANRCSLSESRWRSCKINGIA